MNKWAVLVVVVMLAGCRSVKETRHADMAKSDRSDVVTEKTVADVGELEADERRVMVIDAEEVERVLSMPDSLGRQVVLKETRRTLRGCEVTDREMLRRDSTHVVESDSVRMESDEVCVVDEEVEKQAESRYRWWWLLLVPVIYVTAKGMRRD